jgi:uncharacterized protein YjbI with pentapeptide repeats
MKTEIKSTSGKTLFTCNAKTLRDAIIKAVKSGVDLSGMSLFSADLSGIDLSGVRLSGANLFGVNLSNANLSNANLSNVNLAYANLADADLTNANLSGVNLSWADLSSVILSSANLSYANLSHANLSGANLFRVNLPGANLSNANLSHADLSGADLSCAELSDAVLTDANLSDAILHGAKNIPSLVAARTSIVPETGAFDGWKKCADGVLVHLRIPAHAARSNATSRKCRASEAEVLEIIGAKKAYSLHDGNFVYRVGKTVKADKWNPDRWTECGDGIHFFLTRAEAENY